MLIAPWPIAAAMGLALLTASAVSAAELSSSAAIGNGVLALGVSSDGGLAPGGLGIKFAPTGTDGLAAPCACDARLRVGSSAMSQTVESFTFTESTASSSVLATDPSRGAQLRMTQDFRPSVMAPNLYEVAVTVENLGTSAVQPTYARGLTWLTPTQEYDVALPTIAPGSSVAFRLYFGAGTSLGDATSGFAPEGAALVAQLPGATAFAFGYAAGAAPMLGSAGGSAGVGGGSGGSPAEVGVASGGAAPGMAGSGPAAGGHVTTDDVGPVLNVGSPPDNGRSATDSAPTTGETSARSTPATDGAPTTSDTPARSDANAGSAPTTTTGSAPTTTGSAPTTTTGSAPTTTTGSAPTTTGSAPTTTGSAPTASLDPTARSGISAFDFDPSSYTSDSLPGFQPAATPELDSLTLLASGLGGIGAFTLARWRARKRD
jgi:hypothetical protein